MASIIWFRNDLRLTDNPALEAALQVREPVLPIYIWAPQEEGAWAPGAASRWWLHHSLASLDQSLRQRGSRLLIFSGSSLDVLKRLCADEKAGHVFFNLRTEPTVRERDQKIEQALTRADIIVNKFNGSLLVDPALVRNASGKPYQVFTPFWRACAERIVAANPGSAPTKIPAPHKWPASRSLLSLRLLPTISWDAGFKIWNPGEPGARRRLQSFLSGPARRYDERRNFPAEKATSRLSPHLHFGELSPRELWFQIHRRGVGRSYRNEIGWREFAHYLLFHFPHSIHRPIRERFLEFPWVLDRPKLAAWKKGKTGYPIVDAGLRELWATGWMHNRVRMIVASFLVKDLMIHWREGASWFWDTLVDADLANNTLGWQWSAGCGADAAPYFRIFNPVSQGEKFDPEGIYIRQWIPELRKIPAAHRHHPWTSAVKTTYPSPVVDHRLARIRALAAFQKTNR